MKKLAEQQAMVSKHYRVTLLVHLQNATYENISKQSQQWNADQRSYMSLTCNHWKNHAALTNQH